MKTFTGFIRMGTSDVETFEFLVKENATEQEISDEMVRSFWESSLVDVWFKEGDGHDFY